MCEKALRELSISVVGPLALAVTACARFRYRDGSGVASSEPSDGR